MGALVVLVAVQLSVPGLYLPPVFSSVKIPAAPDDHFTASPHRRVIVSAMGALVVLVAVQLSVLGLYLPPVFEAVVSISSTPDDHFTASPHCRVILLGQSGALVVVVAVQVSVLGLYLPPVFKGLTVTSTPDDHFTTSPNCRVTTSGGRRVGRGSGRPAIRAGIVSPAGVEGVDPSVPPQTIISLPVHTAV